MALRDTHIKPPSTPGNLLFLEAQAMTPTTAAEKLVPSLGQACGKMCAKASLHPGFNVIRFRFRSIFDWKLQFCQEFELGVGVATWSRQFRSPIQQKMEQHLFLATPVLAMRAG